jgi:hypothetical protein
MWDPRYTITLRASNGLLQGQRYLLRSVEFHTFDHDAENESVLLFRGDKLASLKVLPDSGRTRKVTRPSAKVLIQLLRFLLPPYSLAGTCNSVWNCASPFRGRDEVSRNSVLREEVVVAQDVT